MWRDGLAPEDFAPAPPESGATPAPRVVVQVIDRLPVDVCDPVNEYHGALVARAEQHEQSEQARAEAEHPAEQPREGAAVHLGGDSARFGDSAGGLVQEGARVSGCDFGQTIF